MTNATNPGPEQNNAPQRYVIVILGACLVLMLAVSFLFRMDKPGLKVRQMPRSAMGGQAMGGQAMGGDQMGEVGKLMRQLSEKPNDPDLLLQLAEFFMSSQDWDNAQTFLTRALVAKPGDLRTLHHFALTQFQKQQYAEAAETFQQILTIEPDSAIAQFNLGLIYGRFLNKPEKARTLLEQAANSPKATDEVKKNARSELAALGSQQDREAHGNAAKNN